VETITPAKSDKKKRGRATERLPAHGHLRLKKRKKNIRRHGGKKHAKLIETIDFSGICLRVALQSAMIRQNKRLRKKKNDVGQQPQHDLSTAACHYTVREERRV
jgi:hypothetical protein